MHQTTLLIRSNITMMNDFEKIFKEIDIPHVSDELFGKVMRRIQKEQSLAKKWDLFFGFFLGFGMFLAGAVFFLYTPFNGFFESEFFEFFSLIFSDPELVVTYWRSFMFALLESVPIIQGILFLMIIFFFFESGRFFTHIPRSKKIGILSVS